MNNTDISKIRKNSFSLATFIIGGLVLFLEVLVSLFPVQRQYFPVGLSAIEDRRKDSKILGMEKFFFNARKNITTNKMDYPSMLAANIADRAMSNARKMHGTTTLPKFNWISMGPTNTGGHTSSILVDNTDLSHQTIFAGGMTGGVWKSTNGGTTWGNTTATISFSTEDTMGNMNICCLAQDSKGVLYAGTGDGFSEGESSEFSSGELGGGIFKSTDDGATWRLLPSTQPTPIDNNNVKWSYVNRIAIRPDNFKTIYAATNLGVYISRDSGVTWSSAKTPANTKLSGSFVLNSLDVKISTDGSVIAACIGGFGYYCYPQTNDSTFTLMASSGSGHINDGIVSASRIEFTISPTDANRIYASVIQKNTNFGTGGTNSGIFMTMNAKTSGIGGYWYDIGPGGGAFDPYSDGGVDQATYDNTLAVFPANEAQLLLGGILLWEWSGVNSNDTVGLWKVITHNNPYYSGDPLWINSDQHTIAFDQNNPQTVYFGNDEGLFKCSNMTINPADPLLSIANLDFTPINRNYDVTQYYTLCFSARVNYVTVNYNNSTMEEGLDIGGGTQGQGSLYINGTLSNPNDAVDLSGGDGGGCAVSQLNPNIAYFCSTYGELLRENNLGVLATPYIAYTQTRGDCAGGNIDSVANLGGACFVFPMALYENPYDLLNHDSLLYVAQKNYVIGDTIWPISSNGNITYPVMLLAPLASGDTLKVPDRVVSRLAIGFSGTKGGIWINGEGASFYTPIWMPIGGPLSQPTAFSDASPVHALAWTSDGNTLFAGCEDGGVYRFTNINSIIANNYCSGALWYNGGAIVPTGNTNISCTQLIVGLTGRDVLSISTDPKDTNKLLITAGNYGQTDFVYYCSNALSASPTFLAVQGNLPAMPIYSSILDILDSNGNSIPNSAMVATEHGIYTTANITAHPVVWVKNNSGMANVMTQAIAQQTTVPWRANNTGVIYAATHGRGLWASNTENKVIAAVPNITAPFVVFNNLMVYPNPSTGQFNITGLEKGMLVEIYSCTGRMVSTFTASNKTLEFNLYNQVNGIYLIRVISKDGTVVDQKKIVKMY